MGGIFIRPEEVQNVSGSVKSTFGEVEALLSKLNGVVQGMQASYQGRDGAAAQALFQQYHTQATSLNSTLQQIGQAYGLSASEYQDLQGRVAIMFQRG